MAEMLCSFANKVIFLIIIFRHNSKEDKSKSVYGHVENIGERKCWR